MSILSEESTKPLFDFLEYVKELESIQTEVIATVEMRRVRKMLEKIIPKYLEKRQ